MKSSLKLICGIPFLESIKNKMNKNRDQLMIKLTIHKEIEIELQN